MEHLFNNIAYPIVTSEDDIDDALRLGTTRAVILRGGEWHDGEADIFRDGLVIHENAELAQDFVCDLSAEHGRKVPGQVSYLSPLSSQKIALEAQAAALEFGDDALEAFRQKMDYMRGLYERVHDAYVGPRDDESVVNHLLFTPKKGIGRSPMMHVDDVALTMHTTVAGAELRLLSGVETEAMWDAMNKQNTLSMTDEARADNDRALTHLTDRYYEEFDPTRRGDIVIMKGQKGQDLDDPDIRQQMGVHASSPFIALHGQAAAVFYSKKTLDIEGAEI